MKRFSLILALLAIALFVASGWTGPLYKMYDWCQCGQSRTWLEFDDCPSLRNVKFFLRIEKPGNLQHHHEFCDAKYEGQYSILAYTGFGFGLLSVGGWLYPRKQISH